MKHGNQLTASTDPPGVGQDCPSAACWFGLGDWLFVVALVVVVFLVYQPAWHGGLLLDDEVHITAPELRSWQGLYRIWFDVGATQQYYPLSETAFWAQYKLWGDWMTGYHLMNIVFHALTAVMVAIVLRQLAIPGAFLAAAIFALHPVHVESVAWVTEQKNTLSAVLYLGAAMAYFRFDRNRGTGWYLAALALFVLSMFGKIVTVTLPAALLVIFWWQRGRVSWRRDVLPLVPFFAIGAAAGVFIAWVEQKMVGAEGAYFALTLAQRGLLPARVIWFYLGKLVWPADLLFMYPRWQVSLAVWWQYLFPLALLVLLGVLWRLSRRWRGPLAGLLFFAGTLFPVWGFLNVYWFTFSYVADHFQYLASLGVISLAAAGAALLLARWQLWNRPAGHAMCLAVLGVLAHLTWQQSHMYSNAETLYRRTIEENPGCWLAYYNLGNVLLVRDQTDEAVDLFRKALEINPRYVSAYNNLGVTFFKHARFEEAVAEYRKALEINPRYVEAYINLGNALSRQGHLAEAVVEYQTALKFGPASAEAHNDLGNALAAEEKIDEALMEYHKALEINPDYADARNNYGVILAKAGRLDEAIAHFRRALELKADYADARDNLGVIQKEREGLVKGLAERRQLLRSHPDDVNLLNGTAWVLATVPNDSIRDGAAAVEYAQRAEKLTGGREPVVLDTLAAAYAEAGRFSDAAGTARSALELAGQQDQRPLAESIQARIRLYEAGKPFRESRRKAPKSLASP